MIDWYDANVVTIQAMFINLLLALSIQVPMRAGVFSLAGIGSYGIGAYASAIITLRLEWSPMATIAASVLIAAACGSLLAGVVYRLNGLYLGMATIAFSLIVSVVAINGGELTGGAQGLFGAISDLQTWQLVAFCVAVAALLTWSERGRFGRRIASVRRDPELSVSLGIPVPAIRLLSFVAGAALGGSAGAMSTLLRSTVSPDEIGFQLVVMALTMIIVGGSRSWAGAFAGAVILTWLPQVLASVGDWHLVIYGVLVALAAIFVPDGLLGLIHGGYRRVRRRHVPTGGTS